MLVVGGFLSALVAKPPTPTISAQGFAVSEKVPQNEEPLVQATEPLPAPEPSQEEASPDSEPEMEEEEEYDSEEDGVASVMLYAQPKKK